MQQQYFVQDIPNLAEAERLWVRRRQSKWTADVKSACQEKTNKRELCRDLGRLTNIIFAVTSKPKQPQRN